MIAPGDISLETVCTCKECKHGYAKKCSTCICCIPADHIMVLDGINDFAPSGSEGQTRGMKLGGDESKKGEMDIPLGSVVLHGNLNRPRDGGQREMVLFVHGSGSGRFSPRNRFVARVLQQAGFGTLLFDLLTEEEEEVDERTAHLRFDIGLLASRLTSVTDWVLQNLKTFDEIKYGDERDEIRIGYFGASTGAAAALVAVATAQSTLQSLSARRKNAIKAIVSRGGRPDLAGRSLGDVMAPTLLIVGGDDSQVITLNQEAFGKLNRLSENEKKVVIIPGASHLFEEPGKLEEVAQLAVQWFKRYLKSQSDDDDDDDFDSDTVK